MLISVVCPAAMKLSRAGVIGNHAVVGRVGKIAGIDHGIAPESAGNEPVSDGNEDVLAAGTTVSLVCL